MMARHREVAVISVFNRHRGLHKERAVNLSQRLFLGAEHVQEFSAEGLAGASAFPVLSRAYTCRSPRTTGS